MKQDLRGVHHFYYGVLMCLASFFWSLLRPGNWPTALFIVGLVVMVDDFIQHQIMAKKPEFRSPLHLLYVATLYKIPIVRKLNQWVDKQFGG